MKDFAKFFFSLGDVKEKRNLKSLYLQAIVTYGSFIFALLYIYFAGFTYFSPESYVSVYVGASAILIFLLYPMTEKSPKDRVSWLDYVFIIDVIACTVYYCEYYNIRVVDRMGEPILSDTIFGILAIIFVLEVCRRIIGSIVFYICIIGIIYCYAGPLLPGILNHPGTNTEDLVSWLYSSQSIYGTVASIFARYVFLFIIFGTILELVGGGKFFLELPLAIFGRVVGGAAKLSIMASGLFGMITGSVMANVTTIGTFTIPLMKRSGFKPYMAAGTEACSSTVGVTMPPVMGAAIFIMADFTGIPYFDIAIMCIAPSLLFMFSLMVSSDFQARKDGLKPLPKEELPNILEILKSYGHLTIPLIALVALLAKGYSPGYAAFWSIILTLALGLTRKETRYGFSQLLNVMETAVKRTLAVGGLAGAIGIIIGVVYKTGIATKLSSFVVALSGGQLAFVIALTIAATFVLGMGVSSITADYILLSTLLAPALITLGAPVAAAHLLIIWLTQTSNISPPVCLSAFAAAAIAGANPWRTGYYALKIGLFLIILPITFVYSPILDVTNVGMIYKFFTLAIASFCLAAGNIGYMVEKVSVPIRLLSYIAVVLLVPHHLLLNCIGIALFLFLVGSQVLARRRSKAHLIKGR